MNSLKTKSAELESRLTTFAIEVIKLTKQLPKTTENKIIVKQLIKSATSMGANYAEANNAASRIDFRSKIFITKKESAETRFWLRLLLGANSNTKIATLIDEASQFLFIFQKIISTLKNDK